jgi:hypothetical protein
MNRQVRASPTPQTVILSLRLTSNSLLADTVASSTNRRTFEVFNDADNADKSPLDLPRKKARKDSTALQALSPHDLNMGVSSVQAASSNMEQQQKTAPSLKDRAAFRNPNLTHEFKSPSNQISRSTRAMLLSSLNNGLMSPLPQPNRRSSAKPPNDENQPVPTLLGSPFRPTATKLRHSSHSSHSKRALLHRPSDGAIVRYPILKRDQYRRPSDVYARVRRDSSLSYMKHLSPPRKTGLNRDDSFWATLHQSAFKTPPKREEVHKSPSLILASDVTILPIPHQPTHLDTPTNETDQLIADMSEFSLAPKPAKVKELTSGSSQSAFGKPRNGRDITPMDEPQLNSQPISVPGPEPLTETRLSSKHVGEPPLPTKPAVSSSDPLDILPSRNLGGSKRVEASKDIALSGNHANSAKNHAQQDIKKSKKVYGKGNKQKSVAFVGTSNHESRFKSKGGEGDARGQTKALTHSKRTPSDDKMDTSDDELLLK